MRTERVSGRVLEAVGLVALCAAAACGQVSSRHARASDNPRDTDSLYVLAHQLMDDADPHKAAVAYSCEVGHLINKLGIREMSRRVDAMFDSIYAKEPDAQRRMRDADVKLNGIELTDSMCPNEGDTSRTGSKPDTALRPSKPPN